jgi:hypothetical protein
VRIFALIGALLVAGGMFLLVDGGLHLQRALHEGSFDARFWTTEFWLLVPSHPRTGLGVNAHWFVRLAGGVPATLLGMRLVKVATR